MGLCKTVEPVLLTSALPEYTVSQLSTQLRRTVEDTFRLVRVRGELSGVKIHTSGHLYATLKDTDAVLDVICWRGSVSKLSIHPKEGMEVVCTGRLTTYPGRSKYQMIIESMEHAGEGALLKLLEDRKKQLASLGLFDQSRKKLLPPFPKCIGVVTSPTGAVIQDILHRLSERYPCHVIVWPVLVQGNGATEQIARAIEGFHHIQTPPDIIIVARGGGSLEDLWSFNEEAVVRAVANATIPIITAIGHETDTTLVDFASDLRAPTPTAAAELATPSKAELLAHLAQLGHRFNQNFKNNLTLKQRELHHLTQRLPRLTQFIEDKIQNLDEWCGRLGQRMQWFLQMHKQCIQGLRLPPQQLSIMLSQASTNLDDKKHQLSQALAQYLDKKNQETSLNGKLLESYSFERNLERGFAMAFDAGGSVISSKADAQKLKAFQLRFKDGLLKVTSLLS